MNKKQKKLKGFTLIELLVVIAIIGLLATVVMVSVGSVRAKARNAKRISDIDSYRQAIEMYRAEDASGKYPYPNTTGWVCLGDNYPNNKCWSSTSENTALSNALKKYLATLPSGDKVCSWTGYLYRTSTSAATDVDIRWFLENKNQSCGPGNVISGNYSGTGCTYCQLILK